MNTRDPWVDLTTAAERIGISPSSLRAYCERKIVRAIKKRGTRWAIHTDDVDRLAAGELSVAGAYKRGDNGEA